MPRTVRDSVAPIVLWRVNAGNLGAMYRPLAGDCQRKKRRKISRKRGKCQEVDERGSVKKKNTGGPRDRPRASRGEQGGRCCKCSKECGGPVGVVGRWSRGG